MTPMILADVAKLDYALEREYTAGERAGLAAWLFAHGWQPTTAEAAYRLGLSRQGAWTLLEGPSRVLPIAQDDQGRWQCC